MKKLRRITVVMLTLLICFVFVPAAFAHPLGNFTINQYAGLHISREVVVLDYVLDMAEIPAFQEITLFDANGDGKADAGEAAGYHADKCTSLQPSLSLLLNKKPLSLSLTSSSVEFPAGVGGLPTLRLTCEYQAPVEAATSALALSFRNDAYADRLGWQEVVVIPDGVSIQGEYSSTSPSSRLTKYPQNLLTSPLEQREVSVEISAAAVPVQSPQFTDVENSVLTSIDRNDAFTRLILLDEITFPTLLFALAVSLVWGAMHAMTPGHGKTVVGGYLVGSRGTLKHALYLGLTTTVTHTLGVFALGLVTLFAARYILPETLYPWMSLLSGLFVVGIGINLFMSRFRSSGFKLPKIKADVPQSKSPVLLHTHAEGIGQSHKYVLNTSHHEAHAHTHDHGHSHGHVHHDEHDHDHSHENAHHHDYDHNHSHGDHSHMPPGADGEPVTWRSLLALGISGGLLPCPSALVVMLGAIALNKIGFGIGLVLAFSLGLAGALTLIGMMFIYAGRLFERFPSQGRVTRLLPVLSALFVAAIGGAIVWKALGEMGIVG
ncbi:MAG TPA: sulfite exporter TauE/SafE family protein [Anaerolineales bacterium]|nr:sulfite exporter TauE/SafE family protein [Anaerolineales bacterium]